MKKLLGITLGIMTALGGFVDLGQIVFTLQAGALFGYRLLWAIVLGTVAIVVYMEMCGRVAVVTRQPVFVVVRKRLGKKLGLVTLVASNLLNLVTCAAEIGGIAILLRLVTGWPQPVLVLAGGAILMLIVYVLKFEWIERSFGFSGLLMVVFAVSAWRMHPDWAQLAWGLVPTAAVGGGKPMLLYAYFAVGIFSAMLMEYEVHFYSSGAIEEKWQFEDLGENFMVSALGSALGSLLTVGLLVLGATLFLPHSIFPQQISSAAAAAAYPASRKMLWLAIAGMLACISGAAVETALSGGYNICQFFELPWGKRGGKRQIPAFTRSWLGMFVLATVLAISGIEPLKLVNISVIFGMVIMPFTYYPILRAAADKRLMKAHVNGAMDNALGIGMLVLITVAAVAALPLMWLTHSGQP